MLRELAWIEVENEPAEDPESPKLIDDERFEEEFQLAAAGEWEQLGLDPLPDNWQTASIEDLRNDA